VTCCKGKRERYRNKLGTLGVLGLEQLQRLKHKTKRLVIVELTITSRFVRDNAINSYAQGEGAEFII
jgi:hypothetical protein